jgi:hypothetical protein
MIIYIINYGQKKKNQIDMSTFFTLYQDFLPDKAISSALGSLFTNL